MTLREAFDRSPPNDQGDREIIGNSDTGEEFLAIELKDGTISFWMSRGIGATEKWLFDEPQGVGWELKETELEYEVEDYYE